MSKPTDLFDAMEDDLRLEMRPAHSPKEKD
jgi:hypothetical protein